MSDVSCTPVGGLAIVTISSPDHVIGNGDRRKNLYMIHTIFNMLSTQPFVRVFALDFSKAFDTVRHSTLMGKMARLALLDAIYNWMIDFFSGLSHCTKFNGSISVLTDILAG